MMIGCPNLRFPYAGEAVSDAVTRAGFQPVLLAPVNFESRYQGQRQQATGDSSTSWKPARVTASETASRA